MGVFACGRRADGGGARDGVGTDDRLGVAFALACVDLILGLVVPGGALAALAIDVDFGGGFVFFVILAALDVVTPSNT